MFLTPGVSVLLLIRFFLDCENRLPDELMTFRIVLRFAETEYDVTQWQSCELTRQCTTVNARDLLVQDTKSIHRRYLLPCC